MTNDCSSRPDTETIATEISCLNTFITYILKALNQADAGRAILNMEKEILAMQDPKQAEVFQRIIKQIKTAYRS
ncbi:DUF2594 family protein [Arsenophonus endosymbiont of Aphis craccivora]|uniref:DUF2594 family protein n=1 Tax=Arsenophonus endosymbiont of Aphis craccivora TaxID=1231049 RepID=UPI0015DBFD24|nr:DUF2594 family protein [Arsenophonus endosymbiont of Aphis craccivora]QLK87404.1 DUF2594 family protein [Arsenophonus endosymbiont of Aphis craccivora]